MKVTWGSVAILVVLAGCDSTAPYGSLAQRIPEDRGTILGFAGAGHAAVWTSDTTLVFMRASDNTRDLRSVDVTTGQATVLQTLPEETIAWVGTDLSRQTLFYSVGLAGALEHSLVRLQLAGGSPQTIRRIVHGHPAFTTVPFRVTPDGTKLILTSRDSLFEYTATTAQVRFVAAGCDGLLDLSPTSDRALCRKTQQLQSVSLTDGSVIDLPVPSDVLQNLKETRWAVTGIQLLHVDYPKLSLRNATESTSRQVYVVPSGSASAQVNVDFTTLGWSGDARRIAFWLRECVRDTGPFMCENQFRLQVVDVATGTVRNAAVIHEGDGELAMNPVFFSPSGQRIAYLAAGIMWVNDIP